MRLVAGEHPVEHGVAANREVTGCRVRRHRQDEQRCDEDRRGGTARIDDGEEAQAEQRQVQCEDGEQEAQAERGMRQRERTCCEYHSEREREQHARTPVPADEELAEPRHQHRQRRCRHGASLRTGRDA